jgi:hypothetical protein
MPSSVTKKLQAATGKEAEGEEHQDLPPQYCGKSNQEKVPKVTGNHFFSSNPRSSFPCRKTPVLQHQIMVFPDDLVPTV